MRSWSAVLLAAADRPHRVGLPPIRAIRTGRASQAKVPEISLAAVWAGPPLDDAAGKWKYDAEGRARWWRSWRHGARRSTRPRRRSRTFSPVRQPTRPRSGKLLFAGLFDTLNAQRSQVMNGLERVTRKQREAADKIRADTRRAAGLAGRDAARPGRRSTNSAISWSGKPGSSRTAGASSNSSARCPPRSTNGCSRSAA